jgi:hypothetical protein
MAEPVEIAEDYLAADRSGVGNDTTKFRLPVRSPAIGKGHPANVTELILTALSFGPHRVDMTVSAAKPRNERMRIPTTAVRNGIIKTPQNNALP